MDRKILFALPCYNEAPNLPHLIEKFAKLNDQLPSNTEVELLVIDDCSKDNTQSLIQNLSGQLEIKYICHAVNQGLTGGINTAFGEFYRCLADPAYIAFGFMDGDNTQEPDAIVEMLTKIQAGHDVVIASRYCPGSVVTGVTWVRRIYSFVLAQLFRLFIDIPGVKDYSCGFRLYAPQIIEKFKAHYPDNIAGERGFSSAVEILLKAHVLEANCCESKFTLHYDAKIGASKMPYLKTIFGNLKLLFSIPSMKRKLS